ncbi:hypothetical protein [Actinophytocola glycyrrhizae]|uniref:Uncharacterized protein n=1 Tax=Actinophytocola glycyrrhizae TaxID=2044873 RepID=A0ABV9S0H8_9PSEU
MEAASCAMCASDDDVLLDSAKGAPAGGVLVLDTEERGLVAADAQTGAQREFADLPAEELGQPVQAGDRAYIPDYSRHLLYVRDLRTGRSLPDVEVPVSRRRSHSRCGPARCGRTTSSTAPR